MKKCVQCSKSKNEEDFFWNNRDHALCDYCSKLNSDYKKRNAEKIKQQKKEYYEKNKHNRKYNKEKAKIYKKSYLEKNKEKIRKERQKYRKNHRQELDAYNKNYKQQNKEKIKEQRKEYRQKNIKSIKEYKKQYNLKNAKKIKEYSKQYNLNNLEKIKKRQHEYTKAHKAEAFIYTFAKNLIPHIDALQKKLDNTLYCPICNVKFLYKDKWKAASFDHIIPGIQSLDNIHVICRRCNTIKSNLTVEELRLLSEDPLVVTKNIYELERFGIDQKRFNNIYTYKKHQALLRNIEFNLTKSDLLSILAPECQIFKIKLNYSGGKLGPQTFSIDRIDNNKGYVAGNCRVISWKANVSKNNASSNEIKKIYNYIKNLKNNGL